ncbi:MAG: 6,7-dimethyl-8-ribityllumazine synthase [Acidobacteriota bacterium]
MSGPILEGHLRGDDRRIVIVAARFNERIVSRLLDGAVDCLVRHGVAADAIRVVRVPGAWELPVALDRVAARGDVDGLIALGAVIRGETPHFDYVCGPCASGVARVAQDHGLPVAFGVLTCDTTAQAEARAGGKAGNKGGDAASALLEMMDLFARMDGDGRTEDR